MMLEIYRVLNVNSRSYGIQGSETVARRARLQNLTNRNRPMPLLGEMLKFGVDERLSAQQCLQQLTD